MLAHAIESGLIYGAIVGHEADDAVEAAEAVRRPTEEFYVCIVKLALAAGLRVLRVRVVNASVHHLVFAVLVVVVLALLPHVVRRVTYDYRDGSFSLTLHALCIGRRKQVALLFRHV